ncbi:MAG: ABC transporter permease, partial [Flavobacteriales bacterium]|nr:ABC transporter permease [Flavobacteriales bacterium]
MNLLKISWANIVHKPLNSILILLLLSFGVGIISLMVVLNLQLEQQFRRNIKDIDLVLGAKGSSLQLMLSAVYHVDAPTGNIKLKDIKRLEKDRIAKPMIKKIIPMSYGDSYEKFRIVGTTYDYVDHYGATLRVGQLWDVPELDSIGHVVRGQGMTQDPDIPDTLGAVIGSKAAVESGMTIGSTFYSFHGLDNASEAHYNIVFEVVGILEESQTVIDQLILTSLEAIWAIHPPREDAPPKDPEVTAALIQVNNKLAVLSLSQIPVIKEGNMILAIPSVEINRLTNNFGIGAVLLGAIGLIISIISFISVFISLFNSLKDRKYELAIIRTLGGKRNTVFMLILQEGLILSVIGFILGWILSRIGLLVLSGALNDEFHYS